MVGIAEVVEIAGQGCPPRLPTLLRLTAKVAEIPEILEVVENAGRDYTPRLLAEVDSRDDRPRLLAEVAQFADIAEIAKAAAFAGRDPQIDSINGHGCLDCRGCRKSRPGCPKIASRECRPRLPTLLRLPAKVTETAAIVEVVGIVGQDCRPRLVAEIAGRG